MPSELEACREGKGSLIRAFLPWHRQRQMHMGECTCCPPRGTPSPVRMNDQEAVSIELVLQHMVLPSLLLSIKLKEHLFPWKPTLPEQKTVHYKATPEQQTIACAEAELRCYVAACLGAGINEW